MIITLPMKMNLSDNETSDLTIELDDRYLDQIQLINFIKIVQTKCENFQFLTPAGFSNFTLRDLNKSLRQLHFRSGMIAVHYKIEKNENNLSLLYIRHNLSNIILNSLRNHESDFARQLLHLCYKHGLLSPGEARNIILKIEKLYPSLTIALNCPEYPVYNLANEIIAEEKLNRRFGDLSPHEVQHLVWEYIGIDEFRKISEEITLNFYALESFKERRLRRVKNLNFPPEWKAWPTDEQTLENFFNDNGLQNEENLKILAPIMFNYNITERVSNDYLLEAAESNNSELLKLVLDCKADVNFTEMQPPKWLSSSNWTQYDLYLMKELIILNGDRSLLEFNYPILNKIKGNAVILSDRNTACFVFESKIVLKNGNLHVVGGINRQGIPYSNFSYYPIKFSGYSFTDNSENKKEKIIKESLLKRGDIDFSEDNKHINGNYETAFIRAIRNGKIEIIKTLMENPNVVHEDYRGHSSLTQAILYKQQGVLEILTRKKHPKINIRETDSYNQPFLLQVIQLGYFQVVKNLLRRSVSANLTGPEGLTALMTAVRDYKPKVVTLLLEHKAEIDKGNDKGETALIIAAEKLHKDIVSILLKQRANVNCTDSKKNTALMKVCESRIPGITSLKSEIVKILITAGIDISHVNSKEETAWIKAKICNPELCALLTPTLQTPVSISNVTLFQPLMPEETKQNRNQLTTMHFNTNPNENINEQLLNAAKYGNMQALRSALREGANVNCCTKKNKITPLMMACQKGYFLIVEELLKEQKLNKNQTDNCGYTALMIAITDNRKGIVDLLLSKHVNLNVACDEGDTALMIAVENGHDDIAWSLLSYGADLTPINKKGKNAIDLALEIGSKSNDYRLFELLSNNSKEITVNNNSTSTSTSQSQL